MDIFDKHKKFFITGTDTGVGKTYFACRWVRYLAERGIQVGVMKPIETGISCEERSDGYLLKKAAGSDIPIEMISPYRFKTAAAPRVASLLEKKKISIPLILKRYRQLSTDRDWMVVEGAGGLMVPILKRFDMGDLIQSLQLGVVLVAPQKLGTINQTLLSVHLAKNRGLNILAIIINQRKREVNDPAIRSNAKMIYENAGIPVLTYNRLLPNSGETGFWKKLHG